MALIETIGLNYSAGKRPILKGINLSIEQGEAFVLIGPTGAGKTTLLRLLDLLEAPSGGSISFDGAAVTADKGTRLQIRRRMSFVQQKPIVFNMSVFDNVACGLIWRREKRDAVKSKVLAALEMVEMTGYRDAGAKTLSGGEAQRIAIARALVTEPEVLLLDEPTANLDPVSTAKMEALLAQTITETRTTLVLATHDMSQAQRLAGRIGVIINGELLQVDKPEELFAAPRSETVAAFIGAENLLAGVVTSNDNGLVAVDVAGYVIQAIADSSPGDKVFALVRPEDITLKLGQDTSSARNSFRGRVIEVIPHGPLCKVRVDCGFPLLTLVTRRSAEEMGLAPGREAHASFKATAVRITRRWH